MKLCHRVLTFVACSVLLFVGGASLAWGQETEEAAADVQSDAVSFPRRVENEAGVVVVHTPQIDLPGLPFHNRPGETGARGGQPYLPREIIPSSGRQYGQSRIGPGNQIEHVPETSIAPCDDETLTALVDRGKSDLPRLV